ncbi:hypothetical protein ABMA32_15505 [Mesorhizobium sp. VNQ89]|uniref:hypothetical protein n=1 Tax=Mesorhizobium quangtriensis TaxID=3157709 RepID=UPI0032B80125
MNTAFSRVFRSTVATASVALLLAAGVAHSTGTRQIEGPALPQSAAEEAFPDAAFGVDHMVTGPTSPEFKRQQADAGCDQAIWPDVPLTCYPKR